RKWMSRNRATTAAMVSIAVLMLTSFSLFIFLQQTHNATLQGKNSEVQATNQKLVQAEIDAEEKAAEAIASQKEMRSERDRAEREKDIAEEQKARADENSIQANLNQALADRRKQEAEQIAYSSSVAAAAFSLRLNEAEAVSNSLSGCPEPMRGWEWQHLNLAVDPSLGDLIVLGDSVTDLAVSPDGEVVMSYGLGLLPRLWDVDERRDMGAGFKFPGFVVLSSVSNKNKLRQLRCALSPDGFTAAVTSPTDASLRLMNTRTGEFMASFSEASTPILAVDFNADGGLAGVSCEDGHCWVFRVSGQRVVSKFEGHEGPTTGLVFSPDGKRVATCGADRTARIWDALTGDELVRLKGHHTDALSSLAWSPDSSRIVTASYDGSLAVWDTQSGVMISLMNGHLGGVFDVVFSSDNKFVFSGGEDRTVRMWSAATGRQERVFNGHESEVRSVVRLGDEGGIASVDLAGAVRCWDQRWDPSITNLAATDGKSFVKVLFGLSDRVVFAASSLDSLEAFDSNRGTEMDTELGELPKDSSDKGYYRNFAMAQGSGRIVLATSDRRVIVHENRESGPSKVFDGFESISRIAISDDGGAFVVGGKLRNVVVVDVETGVRISIALKHLLASLAISPDGKWVITAESDETLGVWDAQTGKRKASFPNVHSNRISSLCLSADGSLLVSASNDGTARIYTMPDLELRGSEFDHDQVSVSAIALSPVDDRLASGTADGRIRIWSLNTGKMLYSFMGLDGAILSLDFSSDGKRLLGLGRGTGAKIWETANGDERFQARYGSESGANGR
ncbi:MAG: WD40 repeat protein, partial [Planctomycetota bacterium]